MSVFQKYYGMIPLIFICAFFAWKAIDFPIHDFTNYYFGGYFLAQDTFNYLTYYPYHFNKAIAELGYQHLFGSYAPNTPFLALFFYPFSFLKLTTAKLIFNGMSILLFLFGVMRLVLFYNIKPVYLILLPILFFIPIKNNLLFGQVYFLLFFLLSESWLAYEKKQFKTMAIFLGFAILLKVFPVLLVLLFLFKKEFKPLLFTVLFCGILTAITIAFTGLEIWLFYFKTVLSKASDGEIATAFVDNYQSVFMFLKRMLVADVVENPNAIIVIPQLFPALLLGFKVALLAIGFYISRKTSDSMLVISYWILAMLLLSPYGSTYTFILLIFPYLAMAKSDLSNVKKIGFAIGLVVLMNLPLAIFKDWIFPFSFFRLLIFGFGFIGFLTLLYQKINWKIVGTLALVAISLMGFKDYSPTNSTYFLEKNSPILIYDYTITNQQLTYFYWNEKGENHTTIPIEYIEIVEPEIIQNQIHYNGKLITNDNSNKKKPIIINHKTLLYLSDFDRGIGFYTLRKRYIH